MRATTAKNVAEWEKQLRALLGEGSPFADRIADLARQSASRDIKQIEALLDRLRTEVVTAKTRQEHDPNVKGVAYEDAILELTASAAAVYGLTVSPTGTQVGEEADSKKGDHVLLDESLNAVAAIEARARKGVGLKNLLDGLAATARNRGVRIIAYVARSTEYVPAGLGEFSRGRLPLTYKRIAGDTHAIIAIVDPDGSAVAERVALVMWFIDRLRQATDRSRSDADAVQRIESALPCLERMATHLSSFRAVKTGLTKASGQLAHVRGNVEQLETALKGDIARIEEILRDE